MTETPHATYNGHDSKASMSATFVGRKILFVEDDRLLRHLFAAYFADHGFVVEVTGTFAAACESFEASRPDIAVLDFQLPDGTALDLVPKFKALEPSVPIIILTAFGSMEVGISLMRSGVEQCLAKPMEPSAMLLVVEKVLENARIQHKQIALNTRRKRVTLNPFLGESAAIRGLAEVAGKVARSHGPILIQGETGTGKGVLAAWLHDNSPRAEESFVDLNCAGLSREFLETELFGYEKGAYTGAAATKPGLLEVGHRGTIFLDEIGDVDPDVQPKLLKVVEEKRFRHLGDVRDRFVDVRLIAATHQDLKQLIEAKMFRRDLYFRISTFPIFIPPLRERREDLPRIARNLMGKISAELARHPAELSRDAIQRLQSYDWPGNIRELRNVLERAMLLTDKPILGPADFVFDPRIDQASASYHSGWTLREVERFHIDRVLAEENGNMKKTARHLAIAKSTLYEKLKTPKTG
jgi:DNA-binding NtrC family response regulator